MSLKHFLADDQLNQAQLKSLITLALKMKQNPADYQNLLAGKSVVMLFEKPSLRTHISFDIGIQKLGGHALYIGQQNGQLGERERVSDVAKNLACWSDAIVARVFKHQVLQELAAHAGKPVINALCDLYHPCQALADFVTLTENFADLSQVKLAYVGDGNNVSNSLMLMAATLGVDFTLVCPTGFGPQAEMFNKAKEIAQASGSQLSLTANVEALGRQDAIYTDTWVSMGDETKVEDILATFAAYQVNHELMNSAGAKVVMHCQPAHLGQEITAELFDSELSVATSQAENRMWAQNAVLATLLAEPA
ncbi:ornithine carbamoyltransferase [Thalassomonas actiniarum]|uniref:Ornithine carbamoyltransferase n=1 Tax=Thalassomonas actiniarum TaxID=485447 RepID=A0AAE9YSM7_9GAMM|nr:ornithine carbamoyltransferase [Thalassomonas actiniarum]WDD99703.1 ornithine carbamoyltransferase [Thalassomonas actiniarum]